MECAPTPRINPPQKSLVRFNRLRTSVGLFRSCLYKWGMTSSAACECGAEEQTVDHVVLQCPINRPPLGLHGMTALDDKTTEWLLIVLLVEIEMENLNVQVTLLVRKGAETRSYTKNRCGNAKFPHVPTPQHP